MCLKLQDNMQKSKIAEEDIVCYKLLKERKEINLDFNFRQSLHGKLCKVTISGCEEDAIISIDSDGDLFFCQNNHSGCNAENKFGFKFSWQLDINVSSVIIDGNEHILSYFRTPFQSASVKMGETYTSSLNKVDSRIYEGLHSMVHEKDVCEAVTTNGVLVECIIPKGSEYYEGEFSSYPGYASNQLKYVKVIDEKI